MALRWELESERELVRELVQARPSGAELPSGQILALVKSRAIQRRRAPTTLVGWMAWPSSPGLALATPAGRTLPVHPVRRSVRLGRR